MAHADPQPLTADERVVELAPGAPARVVGPGRRERAYQRRIAELEGEIVQERALQSDAQARLNTAEQELDSRSRELEVSQRIERGAQLRLDRIEERFDAAVTRERRLAALVGALQREN